MKRNERDVFGRVPAIPLLIQMHAEVAVALIGILAGALVVVGAPLGGFWQSVDPQALHDLFLRHAESVNAIVIPIAYVAAFVTVLTATAKWAAHAANRGWFLVAAALVVVVVAMQPLYFGPATAAVANAAPGDIAQTLGGWRDFHWLRVAICLAALIAAIRGLRMADLVTVAERSERRIPAGGRTGWMKAARR